MILKKTTILSICFLFFCSSLFAQPTSTVLNRSIGTSTSDQAKAILETADGNLLIGGTSNTTSANGDNSNPFGGNDFWIVKVDLSGNILWDKSYGGSGNDQFSDMVATDDGGYILVGSTNSTNGDVEDTYGNPFSQPSDGWVIKIDANGNKVWTQNFGSTEFDSFKSIIKTSDGNFVLVGTSNGNNIDVEGMSGFDKMWTLKMDPNGNKIWARTFTGNSRDEGFDVAEASNGDLVFTGISFSTDGPWGPVYGLVDIVAVRIDANGENTFSYFANNYGGTRGEYSPSIHTQTGDFFMISCYSSSKDNDVPDDGTDFDTQAWSFQINTSGNIVSDQVFENNDGQLELLYDVISTSEGGMLGVGFSNSNGNGDGWFVKMNQLGVEEWNYAFGGESDDRLNDVIQHSNGNYYGTGRTSSSTGDFSENNGGYDYWVFGIATEVPCNVSASTFPFSGVIQIYELTPDASAVLQDADGNIIFECNPTNGNPCGNEEIITDLDEGTYNIIVTSIGCDETITIDVGPPDLYCQFDDDNDGICNEEDCQPNNGEFPTTPNIPCDDGNPNTINDMTTFDGCFCIGIPVEDCNAFISSPLDTDVIEITGLPQDATSVLYDANNNIVFSCSPDGETQCFPYQFVDNLPDGTYTLTVSSLFCDETLTVDVNFNNGFCENDSDNDGICDEEDCQPFNGEFPTTPNIPCDDGNAFTINDMTTADGCFCFGTFVEEECEAFISSPLDTDVVEITGLPQDATSVLYDANNNIVFSCSPNGGTPCLPYQFVSNLPDGTYTLTVASVFCDETLTVDVDFNNGFCENDSDNDGICDEEDCQPFNGEFPATPGTPCDDGLFFTINDIVLSSGCECMGTIVESCAVTITSTAEGTVTIENLTADANAKLFDSDVIEVWGCNPWNGSPCSNNEIVTNLSEGTYYLSVQSDNCDEWIAVEVTGNSGGCNITEQLWYTNLLADPVICDVYTQLTIADYNGQQILLAYGILADANGWYPCDGGQFCEAIGGGANCEIGFNSSTPIQVVWTNAECGGGACNVSTSSPSGTGVIEISGLTSLENTKLFDTDFNELFSCNPWNGNPCIPFEFVEDLDAGTYYLSVVSDNCEEWITIVVDGQDGPCQNDSDNDGVCDEEDCLPFNGQFPATPGTPCDDGLFFTENDVVLSSGCECMGTLIDENCAVTTSAVPGAITILNLTSDANVKLFDNDIIEVWGCNPWNGNPCSNNEVVGNLPSGTYFLSVQSTNCSEWIAIEVIDFSCPDADQDGLCNENDCAPNNPNIPGTPGTPCNDFNDATFNDVIQPDGCTCLGQQAPMNDGATQSRISIAEIDLGTDKFEIANLFPNPATTEIFVFIETSLEGDFDLQIFDVMGKLKSTTNRQLEVGKNSVAIDLMQLNSGIYHLAIMDKTGHSKTIRFVVNK